MKLGKRRTDEDPAREPPVAAEADAPQGAVTATWTGPVEDPAPDDAAAASEPPVDSDAVELPPAPAPMPEPAAPVAPVPLTIIEPEASTRAPSGVAMPPPVAHDPAIAMSGATPADGHAPADPLMDEIRILATERPEIVVGAAFAGGILAAMILRRLGN
ncbi:MAG TPA: hypothetical protein VGO80_17780 [Solirubrobacteraceae bacterium]|jgi:hypothetical protein|nr:hypothetical protein [Solirubrobacteraceae bacterium]